MKNKMTKQEFNKQSETLVDLQHFMEHMAPNKYKAGAIRYDKKLGEWGIQVFLKGTDKNIQVYGSIQQIRNTCYELIAQSYE